MIEQIKNKIAEKIGGVPSLAKIDKAKTLLFVQEVINGDSPIDYLVIVGIIGKSKSDGVIAYVLTNERIIRIRITEKSIDSTDIYLKQALGVNRQLLAKSEEEAIDSEVYVHSDKDRIGLSYVSTDQKVVNFFNNVEKAIRESKKGSS